ncbi:prepilin-type N-terminal cleavage/methylation domain-containing protein [Acidovorax kalamii]|uniref:prepilin-type N-terminal cleavage/methylation domain-containing protein n=1 Tax=Acidovorax TaxID=12916 RepID=UPI0020900F02|nr:prepilin-type N-terminal cleavage/methylation domain-containing protein [Acidovorax kalamii]MCO5357286.1 prepilin-type N-terminal cleavage/methylation domain-containing protein [Acidovorax kalamii]
MTGGYRVNVGRGGGFTLVELLIVLVLMSLLVLAMGSALRTASQTEVRVDDRLQRVDDLRVVNGFLRSVLGRVSAQKTTLPVELGSSPFFFNGASDFMTWVGVMPARYGAGGRYHFRLGVAEGGVLLLQYLLWEGGGIQPDWTSAQSVGLLSGVTRLALQYQDAAGEPPSSMPQWTVTDRLPDRVMISIQTVAGVWPDIVVPLRVLPASDPRSSGPVFGGT